MLRGQTALPCVALKTKVAVLPFDSVGGADEMMVTGRMHWLEVARLRSPVNAPCALPCCSPQK